MNTNELADQLVVHEETLAAVLTQIGEALPDAEDWRTAHVIGQHVAYLREELQRRGVALPAATVESGLALRRLLLTMVEHALRGVTEPVEAAASVFDDDEENAA